MRKRPIAAASLFVLAIGVGAAYAQKVKASIEIPFGFTVGSTELPAGTYKISTDATRPGFLQIRNDKGDKNVLCPIITRLSSSNSPKPEVVFDKLGEKRIMSEVYLPGADGFQLAGTGGEHTHQKLSGTGQ